MVRFSFGSWARCGGKLSLCFFLLGLAPAQEISVAEATRLGAAAVELLEAGRSEIAPAKLVAARDKFREALAIWLKLDHIQGQAVVVGKIAETDLALGNVPSAIKLYLTAGHLARRIRAHEFALRQYDIALKVSVESGDELGFCGSFAGRGEVNLALGNYRMALENLNDATKTCRQHRDLQAEASAWAALGDLHTRQGRYDLALSALASARNIKVEDRSIGVRVRRNLGVLYTRQGRFEEAQVELEQARALAVALEDREGEGVILTAMARAYTQLGRTKEARPLYERARGLLTETEIPINTAFANGIRPLLANTLNELGELHLIEHDPSLARQHFTSALSALAVNPQREVVLRGGSNRSMTMIEGAARYNLASLALTQGDNTRALEQFRNVLTIARDLSDQALEGRVLTQMGVALHRLGAAEEARKNFQSALAIQVRIEDAIGEILTLGQTGTLDREQKRFADALAALGRAADLLEDVRGSLQASESRMGFLGSYVAIPEMMTSLLATLADFEGAPAFTLKDAGSDYASAALHYAERSRARAWVDLLARTRSDAIELPEELAREERSLIAQRDAALSAYRELAGDVGTMGDRYREATGALRRMVARLRGHVAPAVRAYAALRYPQPVRASEIQAALEPNEVLIEYAVQSTDAVMWVLQRDRPARLVRLPLSSSEIAEDVRQIGAEYQRGFEISEKIVERLYKGLLEPALRGVAPGTRLIVVPDGSLYSLPFETLGWRSATGWRYVADSWIVSYYPSATLFALTRLNRSSAGRSTPARWERPLFAVGDPLYREDGEFKKLEGTRAEIVAIARALGVETASADLKLGADARETVVKQLSGSGALASYRYIHFAAHGLLTAADTPDGQPALVLSQVSDAGEDGYLTMSEVLGLRFAADLIVLSACQSALGDSVPGEGIVGLMRAFFHAGTQSAVVSLWRVDDKSTAELMRYLYEGLAHNSAACGESDKACALNEARKRLRATNPHPYYWAPFVYFGEP